LANTQVIGRVPKAQAMSAGNREHYKGSHLSITQVDETFVNLGDVLKHKQKSTYPATLLSSSGLTRGSNN
jgi:hypothetical protein